MIVARLSPRPFQVVAKLGAPNVVDGRKMVVVKTTAATGPGGSGSSTVSGFGWYTSATLVDGVVNVDFSTPFGIDATTGDPYFDPGFVTPGEEAVLLEDLTLMQPGR